MAYETIRDFIALLEKNGELFRIKAEVDPELEIAEITDRVSKEKGAANKALLFERVKGSTFPVLTNAFGSLKRMCLALEVHGDTKGRRAGNRFLTHGKSAKTPAHDRECLRRIFIGCRFAAAVSSGGEAAVWETIRARGT